MRGCYHGHLTREDGSHVLLSADDAQALWDAVMQQKMQRAETYPTEAECLRVMSDIRARLSDMGWRDAIYCPKDGTVFDAIEFGCTTIFDCWYQGEWPKGSWWMATADDCWPTRPVAFRLKTSDKAASASRNCHTAQAIEGESPAPAGSAP